MQERDGRPAPAGCDSEDAHLAGGPTCATLSAPASLASWRMILSSSASKRCTSTWQGRGQVATQSTAGRQHQQSSWAADVEAGRGQATVGAGWQVRFWHSLDATCDGQPGKPDTHRHDPAGIQPGPYRRHLRVPHHARDPAAGRGMAGSPTPAAAEQAAREPVPLPAAIRYTSIIAHRHTTHSTHARACGRKWTC